MSDIKKSKEYEVEYTKDKIELIKRTYAKGASDDEFALLLELSKRYQLDPFKKQIFYIPGSGVLVSHAGLIHIAHQSGYWAGMKTLIITKTGEEVYVVDDNKNISGAVCYIYRKDWNEPLVHAVSFQEYFKPSSTGYPGAWERMPQTMIKKVAEAGALRRAFDLGGLYIQEEMSEFEVFEEVEEEKEIKQKNVSQNSTYLVRLMTIIDAAEKRYNLNKKKTIKYLEKTFNKKLEEFSNEDLKQSEQIIKKIIEKNQEKVEKDEIKKIEVKVEEPVNETEKGENFEDWINEMEDFLKDESK